QINHHANALAVRLVANVGDTVDLLLAGQFGDLFDKVCLVDLIGQLGDDDADLAALGLLAMGLGADDNAAAPGAVGITDAFASLDDAPGREVGPFDDAGQVFDGGLGVIDEVGDAVADLAQVVGRDVGSHADGDAGGAIDK